jgi:hypothetical protein
MWLGYVTGLSRSEKFPRVQKNARRGGAGIGKSEPEAAGGVDTATMPLQYPVAVVHSIQPSLVVRCEWHGQYSRHLQNGCRSALALPPVVPELYPGVPLLE